MPGRAANRCSAFSTTSKATWARAAAQLTSALPLALAVGYFLFGAMVGLYALMPAAYPTEVRNTGAGLSIGIGRIGAMVAPLLAGFLLEAGWSSSRTYLAFAVPLLVAAVATFVLGRLRGAPAALAR